MATIKIDSIFTLGMSKAHTKTDWEIYTNSTMDESSLLYRSLDDGVDLLEKHCLLRYPDGRLYEPSDPTYVRCRVWFDDTPSNWVNIIDKDCPHSNEQYEYDLDEVLHKAYHSNKGMSQYESSPYITDIKKVK